MNIDIQYPEFDGGIFTGVRWLLAPAIAFLISACGEADLTVTAEFENTQDIKENVAVIYQDNVIGEVKQVNLGPNGSTVELSLDEAIASELNTDVAVVVNRVKEGAPLELYNGQSPDAEPLRDGQTIKGLDSMMQLGAWLMGDAIELGSKTINDYANAFQDYLNSDKFQRDKDQVEEQVESALVDAADALRSIESELAQAADEFINSEKIASDVIQQFGDELAPTVRELAKQGAKLTVEMDEIVTSLEQTMQEATPAQREAGRKFINSLIEMLEGLDAELKQGAVEGKVEHEILRE